MFYSFQCISLSPAVLNLFIDILLDSIANGIVFLIFFMCSILETQTDLCVLMLYPETWLNLFISTNFFGENFLNFLCIG